MTSPQLTPDSMVKAFPDLLALLYFKFSVTMLYFKTPLYHDPFHEEGT